MKIGILRLQFCMFQDSIEAEALLMGVIVQRIVVYEP